MTYWNQRVVYDGSAQAQGDAPTFSRNQATRREDGETVAANERRFATRKRSFATRPMWTNSGVTYSGGTGGGNKILNTGYDSDNTTPLVITKSASNGLLEVYSGEEFTSEASWDYTTSELTDELDAPTNHSYEPEAAVIFYGCIVVALERTKGSVIRGCTFIYSVNRGKSWNYVPAVGVTSTSSTSIGDIPPIEAGGDDTVANNLGRLNRWSFSNPFPVNGLNDTQEAWLPWADYLSQSNDTKGGQVGLIKISRANTGRWKIGSNRLVYERWESGQNSARNHCHGAFPVSGGMVSIWGDTAYRNAMFYHAFDLSDYENASVTTTKNWHGGWNQDADQPSENSPQGVAPAPRPGGGAIMSGDTYYEAIYDVEDAASASERPQLHGLLNRVSWEAPGLTHNGMDALHLHWFPGRGWAGAASASMGRLISRDGVTFSESPRDISSNISQAWFFYGDVMLSADRPSGSVFVTSPIPEIYSARTLMLARGGENLALRYDNGPGGLGNPSANNTVEPLIVDSSGVFRKVSDNTALDPQPSAIPIDTDAMFLGTYVDSFNMGALRLRSQGGPNERITLDGTYCFQTYQFLYDDTRGVGPFYFLRSFSGSSYDSPTTTRGLPAFHDVNRWIPFSLSRSWSSKTNAVPVLQTRNQNDGNPTIGKVIHAVAVNKGPFPSYPIESGVSGAPDEEETIPLDLAASGWSIAVSAFVPDYIPLHDDNNTIEDVPVATIYGDANNHIFIHMVNDSSSAEAGDLVATITSGGTEVASITLDTKRPPINTPVNFIVSSDGTNINFAAEVHTSSTSGVTSGTSANQLSTVPTEIRLNSNADQSNHACLEFFGTAAGKFSMTTSELEDNLASGEFVRDMLAIVPQASDDFMWSTSMVSDLV